jgi:glycosyltransferase involved in cell wall biosynthesis
MRILHVLHSADPAGGGPTEAVIRLSVEHQRSGRSVELVTLDDPKSAWLRDFPLRLHALGPVSSKYGYTRRLVPWLVENSPSYDVIVANGLWQFTSYAVWRAARRTETPYVVFPHGMLDPWFKRRYPLKHLKKWLYWPWGEYRVLRDAAAVLFTSEEEQRLARQSFWLYRCKERVVRYGTAPPPDDAARQRERFLQAFPAVAGTRPMLFFGRLHEKKGCDLLIRAFASAAASAQRPVAPWHLVLAGPVADEGYRVQLESLARTYCPGGSVTWTGMLTGDLKWGAFRTADVFVLPSHQENFGVAVAEALACGVPVLISDKVNIWREVQHDRAGFVDADNDDGARRLLTRWMALDDVSREQFRRNARHCFATRFRIEEASRQIGGILRAVAG